LTSWIIWKKKTRCKILKKEFESVSLNVSRIALNMHISCQRNATTNLQTASFPPYLSRDKPTELPGCWISGPPLQPYNKKDEEGKIRCAGCKHLLLLPAAFRLESTRTLAWEY